MTKEEFTAKWILDRGDKCNEDLAAVIEHEMSARKVLLPNKTRREIKEQFKNQLAWVVHDKPVRKLTVSVLVKAMDAAYHALKRKEKIAAEDKK